MGCLNVSVTDTLNHWGEIRVDDASKHLKPKVSFVCVLSDQEYELYLVEEGAYITSGDGNYVVKAK